MADLLELVAEVVGAGDSVGFVVGVLLLAKGRRRGIENHHHAVAVLPEQFE